MWDFLYPFFTVPGLLIGTLAASIPFILHLIYKKRAPKVPFPTLMFLLASVRKTAHRRRLQELLLLILRALVLFLLAIGLAGFHLPSFGAGGTGETSLGLVVDNSFSMATQVEATSRYEQAKQLAKRMIEEIGKGSSVAPCYTHVTPPPEGKLQPAEELTQDLDLVKGQLISSDVSYGHGSVTAAILQAEKILSRSVQPTRFLYVVSDLQAVGWNALDEPMDKTRPIPILLADCGSGGYRNIAVTALNLHGKGRAVGVPITIEAKLLNSSTQEQSMGMKCFVDKREPLRRTVSLEKGATASVSFTTTFDTPGPHAGWVEVETQDSLDADNRRYFALEVSDRMPALLVKKENAAVPILDEAYYLVRALDPAQGGVTTVRSVIQPRETMADQLATADLSAYAVVFLLDVPRFSDADLAVLSAYAQNGGTLVVFCGDEADRESYNRAADPPLALLPARLGEPAGNAFQQERYATPSEVDVTHPILVPFKGLPRRTFESVHVWRWHTLLPVPDRPVSVLMRLDNRSPFLMEGKVGAGRVLMFCVSAGAEWSNFPAPVLYQPLMHEIVYSSASTQEQSLSHYPGAPVHLGVSHPSDDMELTDPLGNVRRHVSPTQFAGWAFAPGVYRWKEMAEPFRQGAFVVNPVPEESDLTPLSPEKVREMLRGRAVYIVSNADGARRVVLRLQKGVQLWTLVLFLVLAVAVAECFFANRPPRQDEEKARVVVTFARTRAKG